MQVRYENEIAILELDDGKANALGHDAIGSLVEKLDEDLEFFKVTHSAGIYKRQLIAETVVGVGHLLYSLWQMNKEDLKTAFWNKYHIDISLRWRIMKVHDKYVKYDKYDTHL